MTYDGAKVIKLADAEVGTREGPDEHNPFGAALGLDNTLWCSVFVSFIMKKAGFESLYPVTVSTRVSFAHYKKQHWIVPRMDARAGDIVWMFFPPRIGPATGPTKVVIAQITVASVAFSFGNTRRSSICDNGMIGPPTRPSRTRVPSSMPSELDMPHRTDTAAKPR